jgi:hypothetical protein
MLGAPLSAQDERVILLQPERAVEDGAKVF